METHAIKHVKIENQSLPKPKQIKIDVHVHDDTPLTQSRSPLHFKGIVSREKTSF